MPIPCESLFKNVTNAYQFPKKKTTTTNDKKNLPGSFMKIMKSAQNTERNQSENDSNTKNK